LHKFAGAVTIAELRSAVLLGLIGLVTCPILPDRFVDRSHVVNLRQAWITVTGDQLQQSHSLCAFQKLRCSDGKGWETTG